MTVEERRGKFLHSAWVNCIFACRHCTGEEGNFDPLGPGYFKCTLSSIGKEGGINQLRRIYLGVICLASQHLCLLTIEAKHVFWRLKMKNQLRCVFKRKRVLISLLVTLKSTVLIGLDWPVMSPLLVPVSARKTWPNFSRPSPTTTILNQAKFELIDIHPDT